MPCLELALTLTLYLHQPKVPSVSIQGREKGDLWFLKDPPKCPLAPTSPLLTLLLFPAGPFPPAASCLDIPFCHTCLIHATWAQGS